MPESENLLKTEKLKNFSYKFLIFASFFLYVILYASRNLYVAEKTTLQALGNFGSFTDLAATMEYYFYAYAIMQVGICFFMTRVNVKWLVTITISVSSVLTILVAFTSNVAQQWWLFIAMGVCQACVWGSLLKNLGKYLPEKMLASANVTMASGPAVGFVLSYVIAAVFGDDWTTPFILLGVILMITVIIYFYSVTLAGKFPRHVEIHHVIREDGTEEEIVGEDNDFIHLNNKKRVVGFYLFSALIGLLFAGLYTALSNNLDLFLKQVGGFNNTVSKYITILVPVMVIVGPFLMVKVCDRFRDFIKVSFVGTLICLMFLLPLLFFFNTSVWLSLALFLAFLIVLNGIRSVTLSIASLKLRDRLDTGLYSTVVNVPSSLFTGVGPKLFTIVVDNPALSITQNWTNAFLFGTIWCAVTMALLIGCIFLVKLLHKIDNKNKKAVSL
jgi:sugar phosphate permease